MSKEIIPLLRPKAIEIFREVFGREGNMDKLNKKIKSDQTLVTAVDIKISKEFKKILKSVPSLQNHCFFCEEDLEKLFFPAIILDPIDGTNEMSKGFPECAVSLAVTENKEIEGLGWIFNPFNGFQISTNDNFVHPPAYYRGVLSGLISRSEESKGWFDEYDTKKVSVSARGSIAYKLGLLAAGATDFVISKEEKYLWDIAAGNILCHKRGIHCYQNGIKVKTHENEYLEGPFLWCREQHKKTILDAFGLS